MKYKRDANKLLEAFNAILALPFSEEIADRVVALLNTFAKLKHGTKHQELWTYIADKAADATDAWMTKHELHEEKVAMEYEAAGSTAMAGLFADGEPCDEGFIETDFH